MKKIKFTLLSLLSVLFLFSCSSDDDKGIDTSKLLGKWYIYSITENGTENLYENDCEDMKDYLNFKSTGFVDNIMYEYDETSFVCIPYNDPASYNVSGNKIYITYEGEAGEDAELIWTVQTLNDNSLIVKELDGIRVKFTRN